MRKAAYAMACLLVVLVALPVVASADDDAKRNQARSLLLEGDKKFRRGERLLQRGKMEDAFVEFELALAEYQAAYELYPNPQIFFPIAQAEQRLGRFVEALGHYQQLLDEGNKLSAELRSQAKVNILEVKKNLAAFMLEISPDTSVILIDGKEVAAGPLSQPLFLEPGEHTYAVKAEGHIPIEGKVDLLPGKELRKRVALKRQPVVVAEPKQEILAPTVDAPTSRPSKTPLWIGLGATGLFTVSATVTGFVALSKHSSFNDSGLSDAERESAREDGKRMATTTDLLAGAAVVSGLVTAYYYYGVYKPALERSERQLTLSPVIGADMAGVAAIGTFW